MAWFTGGGDCSVGDDLDDTATVLSGKLGLGLEEGARYSHNR